MKRKFLEDLGLEKEAIDKIMTENGNDIEAVKADYGTLEQKNGELEEKLLAANQTIEGFSDYEQTKQAAKDYKQKLEQTEQKYAQEAAERTFHQSLEKEIVEAGGIDDVAIKAHMDVKMLMESKDQSKDILSAIESIKAEKGYLFGKQEPITVAVTKTDGTKLTDITPEGFKKMGYKERLELKTANPQKYEELRGN